MKSSLCFLFSVFLLAACAQPHRGPTPSVARVKQSVSGALASNAEASRQVADLRATAGRIEAKQIVVARWLREQP